MAEVKEARVPDIGGYDDVPVIELLVAVGDRIDADQGLITLESDKATMEVPSSLAGKLVELKVKLGDSVSEGDVVALIEVDDTAGGESPADEPAAAEAATAAKPEAPAAKPDAPAESAPAPATPASPAPAASPVASSGETRSPPVAFTADELNPDSVPYASPAVRLFARELGVDLGRVSGSGRKGRIQREDVQNFVKTAMQGGAAPSAGGGGLDLLPWPKVDFARFGPVESQPLSRIQKISGANLARNWAMIPHVTQHDDADITELEALRVALNEENAKAIEIGRAHV